MEYLAFERRHSTGVLSRVYRDDEGAGYRPAAYPVLEHPVEPEWPYVDTIDKAQALADSLAHPDCVEAGCGEWSAADTGLYRP